MPKPKVKLPIVKLGSWHSDKYGTVSFTQEDLNSIIETTKNRTRGYEPYARYGHNQKGAGIHGGERALAHLVDVEQQGDVLLGVFEANNPTVVEEIKRGEYRYTSAEVVRNAKNVHTGERIRAYLKGVALTNEPFIPDLPRVDELNADLPNELLLTDSETSMDVSVILLSDICMTCPNCGSEVSFADGADGDGDLDDLCKECAALLKPRQNEELTTMQQLLKTLQDLPYRVASLVTDMLPRAEVATELYTDETPKTDSAEAGASEEAPDGDQGEKTPTPGEGENADVTPTEGQEEVPPAAEKETPMDEEKLKQFEQLLSDMEAVKAALDAKAAEADEAKKAAEEAQKAAEEALAAKEAAEKALAEKEEAEKAAAEEAARIEAEKAEAAAIQMLTDRRDAVVNAGVLPVLADRALELAKALRSQMNEQTILLSDGAEPIDLTDAIFNLLTDSPAKVDFEQHGEQEQEQNLTDVAKDNPWGDRLVALRKQNSK